MDVAIVLDHYSETPLHQQLYDELRQAILSGRLLPRQKLPSTRAIAQSLSISRTTATQSYDRLQSEGYLETIVGSGTYVCAQLPDDWMQSLAAPMLARSQPLTVPLSRYGATLAQTPFTLQPEPDLPISFRYGRPALREFPLKLWRKLLSRRCCADSSWLDYATDFQGYFPLRQAIAQYLCRSRAVQCQPEQIVITNGTQQGLDLILRLLIETGDAIAIEEPGYLSARRIFQSHGAKLIPIPVDASGLMVEQLVQPAIRLVYVTPSHQFPTGATLSLPRRLELLTWAQQNGALILEDDYDSEYRYGDRPMPALQGLDQNDSVLYLGTFSKVLFPALRLGYLVLPPHFVALFAQAKWLHDRQLPMLEQQVLTDFIAAGYLESHIRKMRSRYDRCRQVLVQELHAQLGDQVAIFGEKAGLHLMVRLYTPWSNEALIARAAKVGVGLMSAQAQYLGAGGKGEFIFGYSELNETQIRLGVQRLVQAIAPGEL
ncbi:PLP-dependent aminotransferase family protein [Leptolyngbya sp. FACHB-321]|uniref:MocR-like pyridoxine biosynthesis transcription factor PdxR n=1 Tax=Leptolyngbya sp. FACHB-321 TaxID=2692807 RepID=UPI001684886B|nr:PLP-dependent aminotransferase family protein [Leptolyngbya sp. FACHB-321]MBD2035333.1 PLP-dependent aminotransferase family protein [Leptolyngbya sp. FACHB-321]